MQEDNFSGLSQQRPQIKREMEEKAAFSYLMSSDIMYQKLIGEGRYAEYENGLLESIYTNGYSDQYLNRYINETLEKNNLKLFAENKAIAEKMGFYVAIYLKVWGEIVHSYIYQETQNISW